MIPQDTLSSEMLPSAFIGASATVFPDMVDYEEGGIGLQDTTYGLQYQLWKAEVRVSPAGDEIAISAPTVAPFVIHTGRNIVSVSLAFDQNMNPVVAFVEAGIGKLSWFDTGADARVVTDIGEGVLTPKVSLDDKRPSQLPISDIILSYIKDGGLYYRQQRNRYQIERKLADGPFMALVRTGMGADYRFQWQVILPDSES